jgi:hypothetical protein
VMGEAARKEFEAKYTAQKNYSQLLALYQRLVEEKVSELQPAACAGAAISSGGVS